MASSTLPQLMDALQFTKEDLSTNKSGALSVPQKKALQEKYIKSIGMIKKFAVAVIVVILIVYLRDVGDIKKINALYVAGIIGGSAAYYALMIWFMNRKQSNILEKDYQIEVLSGPVEISFKNMGGGYGDAAMAKNAAIRMSGLKIASCEIKIAGKKLYVENEVGQMIEKGKNYTFYCIKENNIYIPVSVEVL